MKHKVDSILILFGVIVVIFSVFSSLLSSGYKNNNEKKYSEKPSTRAEFITINPADYIIDKPVDPIIIDISSTINVPVAKKKVSGSTGTAFRLGQPGTWVTARHVVEGCQSLVLLPTKMENYTDQSDQTKKIEKVFIPPSSDLAIMLTRPLSNEFSFHLSWQLQSGANRKYLPMGEKGYAMGFPTGKPGQAQLQFAGYVRMRQNGIYEIQEPAKMWVQLQQFPQNLPRLSGISGGPIFDSQGLVVGVYVASSVRRGRGFSVDEYSISWLLNATGLGLVNNDAYMIGINDSSKNWDVIGNENWSSLADEWRDEGYIRKLKCYL